VSPRVSSASARPPGGASLPSLRALSSVRALLLLAPLVAACAQTGDFGRPVPSTWNALVATTGSVAAVGREEPVSGFALTDDETELRDRAWRFLMPAHERASFAALVANMTRSRVLPASWHPSDPAIYFEALAPARSPASRYRRLSEDVVADGRLLPPFALVAARVVAADGVRLRSLPFVQSLDQAQVRDAAMRVAENRCLVAWVRYEAGARAAAYRFALERLVVETPQADAVGPERSLVFLDERRGTLEGLLPPGAAALCGFPAEPLPGALAALAAPPPLVVKD
jgi:hypothetical protein